MQYWKSNPMHWCDYCKVWMQDNPGARATHEKGVKHKDNVARSKFWPWFCLLRFQTFLDLKAYLFLQNSGACEQMPIKK